MATRQASGKMINALAETLPSLIGGSADLAGSNNTTIAGAQRRSRAASFVGRNLHFGVREHGMGAIATAWRCTAASARTSRPSSSSATTCGRRSGSPR